MSEFEPLLEDIDQYASWFHKQLYPDADLVFTTAEGMNGQMRSVDLLIIRSGA